MKIADLRIEDVILDDGNIADWVESLEKVWSVYLAGMATCKTFEDDDIWQAGNVVYYSLCCMVVDYVRELPERYRWTIVAMWCNDGISVERYHKAIMMDDCFDTCWDTTSTERHHSLGLLARYALD